MFEELRDFQLSLLEKTRLEIQELIDMVSYNVIQEQIYFNSLSRTKKIKFIIDKHNGKFQIRINKKTNML